MAVLFEDAEHEPLCDDEWNESQARDFVARTVRETDDAFDSKTYWPLHPEDSYGDETEPYAGVYCGAAGTMWALHRLAARTGLTLKQDYAASITTCGASVPSYFMGTTGVMAARYAITNDSRILDELDSAIRANVGNPTREPFWGSSGCALAALLVRERDGDDRFDETLRLVQDELWTTWEPPAGEGGRLWEQDMYGRRSRYVGSGHGAVGNLAPLVRGADLLASDRCDGLLDRIAGLLETYVIRDGDAVNWWSMADPLFGKRMQWCHGAPGIIIGLASLPATDSRIEELLVQAGEGIWRAGPLRKGPTFCHGTAGNGYALLRLARRTGDNPWLHRAQRFAMHAMRQVDAWRTEFGMPSFSLWTGEPGVALFVDGVLRNDPSVLALDVL